jgi:peptidylprolyl isomerase
VIAMRVAVRTVVCVLLVAACGGEKPARPKPIADKPAIVEDKPKPEAPPKTPPPEAQISAEGLASVITKRGAGDERAQAHDKIRVLFSAWNEKGKLVDSSDKRGGPVVFELSGVIEGWRHAVPEMQVGEKRRLWVPDALAYPGRPGSPRGMSVFDIELLEIIKGLPKLPAPLDVAKAPKDANRLDGGISYKTLTKGTSQERPRAWDRVAIHYTGWTSDGTLVESSRGSERAAIFDVDKVMPGWRTVLPLLSIGESARVWLPEAQAYQGRGNKPKSPVVFDLELVSIERKPEPPRAPADVAAVPRDAQKTKSGLAYRMLEKGSGSDKPRASDRVEVHYAAWTQDGALFDSSHLRGKPAHVPLAKLIPGWSEGLQLMSPGDKALFWIPEPLAYAGREGSPKGMLVYEVELLSIDAR